MSFLMALLAATLLWQSPAATVEGLVRRSDTFEPIAEAKVILHGNATAKDVTVVTAADGRFVFNGVVAGDYRLRADAKDYASGEFGRTTPYGAAMILSVQSGDYFRNLPIDVFPTGSISGKLTSLASGPPASLPSVRLLDGERPVPPRLPQTGVPARGVTLRLLRRDFDADGRPVWESAARAVSDDEGRYRFSHIPSGVYRLRNDAKAADDIRIPTYFPGTMAESDAALIELRPGQIRTGLDFAVASGRLMNIRGEVIDGLRRRLPHIDWLTIGPRDAGGGIVGPNPSRIRFSNTATFEIPNVLPGSYYITHYRLDDEKRAQVVVAVDVRDRDIDDLLIVSIRGCNMRGRVHFEEGDEAVVALAIRGALRMTLRPLHDLAGVSEETVAVDPNGTARFIDVPCGTTFQLFMRGPAGLAAGYYVKSATMGKTDVLQKGISPDGPYPLEVVLSRDWGHVVGRVVSDVAAPTEGSHVVLMPIERGLRRPDLYKVANTDQFGRFRIANVVPGDYELIALKELEGDEYYSPDFRKRVQGLGQLVRVRSGAPVEVQLSRTR